MHGALILTQPTGTHGLEMTRRLTADEAYEAAILINAASTFWDAEAELRSQLRVEMLPVSADRLFAAFAEREDALVPGTHDFRVDAIPVP